LNTPGRPEPDRSIQALRPNWRIVSFLGALTVLIAVGCTGTVPEARVPSLPPATVPTVTTTAPTATPLTPSTTITSVPADRPMPIRVGTDDDFEALVETAPEGTSFVIEPGVHRLVEIRPKDGMSFLGRPGSVMSGAIEVRDWAPSDDGFWQLDGISMTALEHGDCIEGYEGCRLTQDLFMDDVMLWQVTDEADLGPGRWYWEGDRIVVADDPTSRRVELSTATYAFMGDAHNVTIRGLVVEKYAVPAQFGAIQSAVPGDGPVGRGWLVEDSEVRLNHGAGIRTGEATVLRNVFIHHNGQLGIAGSGGTGGVVEQCEIASNNIAGFNWGWEAGGAKFTETRGLVVRNNSVHDNGGPGLWTDINNYDTLYEGNTVVDNYAPGIFHEISYDAVIRNNTVTGNGFGSEAWLWGSGILIAASSDVEVYGNTVRGNADGIGGIQQDREDGPEGAHLLSNLFVHDNSISVQDGHIGIVEDFGDDGVFTERGNRFESNTYVDVRGRRYVWDGRTLDADGWMDAGQDLDGGWRETPGQP